MGEKSPSYEILTNQNNVLKDVINSSWNALGMISFNGDFKFVNNAFVPILNYSQNELLKMNLKDILLEEYIEPFEKLLKENLQSQYTNNTTIGCKRKDKQIVYLQLVINLMSNKKLFVINVHEVTASVNEKKLFDQYIIQFNIDQDGIMISASNAFYKLTGYSQNQINSKHYSSILHNEDENYQPFIDSVENNIAWSGILKLKKYDSSLLIMDLASHPKKNKYGDIVGFSAIMIDMTSHQELIQHEEFLEKKLIAEEEKLNIMSETIRTVAHEWRQPLNSISLVAQSLAFDLDFDDELDKENMKEKLEGISNSTQELSQVIANFQSFTEPQGQKEKGTIEGMLNKALQIAKIQNEDFVEENYSETKSFTTYVTELTSALALILNNAKEYSLKKDNPHILIKTYELDNNIVCEISNNGGHIPDEIKAKIFTPYFSTKEKRNGVGLSLYTCKIIIELHLKGSIEVKNCEENYALFKLTFPIGALEE